MQYALLIYEDESVYGPEKNNAALQEIAGKHMSFSQELGAKRLGGAGLAGTHATTSVRSANGARTVHDGPFAETKEQLGGFYIIEAADLDEAIGIAKRMPLQPDGTIEIRPLMRG
jgi:hypothetical protein